MSRGGMRFGAGRPGWKRKAGSSLAFDIREIARRDLLRPGTVFNWAWTNSDGKRLGNIDVRVTGNPEALTLYYQWSVNSGSSNQIGRAHV